MLGDYVDRGLKSKQVVEQIKSLHKEWGVVVLKGNHDDMMVKAFTEEDEGYDTNWLSNGAYQTIESYCGIDFFEETFDWDTYIEAKKFIKQHYQHHIDFLQSLPLYHETDEYIFVHAGINPFYEDWKKQSDDDFIWIRDIFHANPTVNTDKTVIFGHTPTVHLQETEDIWFSPHGDKIGIDGACAYGMQLNCLEINDKDGYREHFVRRGTK
ncbi:diadenosine tetraphosphatase [compost metagenome]